MTCRWPQCGGWKRPTYTHLLATLHPREGEEFTLSKRFINEALETLKRAFDRLERPSSKLEEYARKLRMSVKYIARFVELMDGENEVIELLNTTEDKILKTIRVNTLKINKWKLMKLLEEKGFTLKPISYVPYALAVIKSPMSIGATHEYLLGYYIVQSLASMFAPLALYPYKGPILDACAGAGAKTTQIAQHNPNELIVAVDISKRKLLGLKNHVSRLGIPNVVAIRYDVRYIPRLNMKFQTALVDAPCTGEGLIVLPKGRKMQRDLRGLLDRVKLQLEILASVVESVIDSGIIVYSTCSTAVEENEYVVSIVAQEYGLRIDKINIDIPARKGIIDYLGLPILDEASNCIRLYPHIHRTEGFTICRLVKK
ncbi:MAG TPA: RsmB/NOP family class I SAM-dependent RNA methyltransferase [Pyrodictiaceae archaeon]|nr:RsmB/NOP family class I SAM-dependent RNA methyltransferase [Pyrodictiaceae archaeon]HIQ56261.1 RsmB/NOP family class I SAM-dependent RNA methyltransferase [Pyrodictium sp.]